MLRPVDAYQQSLQNPLTGATQDLGHTAALAASKSVTGSSSTARHDDAASVLDESVDVSSESRAKLAQIQDAEALAKQTPAENTAGRASRVAQLKALVANDAIKHYFDEVSSHDIAGSMLKHPLSPAF